MAVTIDARRESLERVTEAVRRVASAGGVIIFPTDTVYGIGCDPARESSIARIYAAKGRPAHKPLSLHLATVQELLEYAADNPSARRAAEALLPGPLTIIVRRPPFVSPRVTADGPTLGLRVPDDTLCRAILEASGPLAATSANLSGAAPYTGGEQGHEQLPDADLIVEAGPTPRGVASTVIDLSGEQPVLIREGSLPRAQVEAVLGSLRTP
ncbi:threonylcarbamoyl-AMP synthase [bacterium]|nr:MAG: threonylcarbamoyl-AMP synthase [bacterium]